MNEADLDNKEELKKHSNLILTMGVVLQSYGLYREHIPAIDFKNLYDKRAADYIYEVLVAYLKYDIKKEVFGKENDDLTLIKESYLLNSLPELLELMVSTKKLDSNVEADVANILIKIKELVSHAQKDNKEADNDKNNDKQAEENAEKAEDEKYEKESKYFERCAKLFNDRDADVFRNFVAKENESWRKGDLEEALKTCQRL